MDSQDRGIRLSGCTKVDKGQDDRLGGGDDNGGAVGFRQGCIMVRSK